MAIPALPGQQRYIPQVSTPSRTPSPLEQFFYPYGNLTGLPNDPRLRDLPTYVPPIQPFWSQPTGPQPIATDRRWPVNPRAIPGEADEYGMYPASNARRPTVSAPPYLPPLPQARFPEPAPGLEPGTLGTRTIGGEVSPMFNPPGMPDTDEALAIPSSGWVRRFPNWVVRQTIPEEKSNLPSPVGQATATGDYYHQTPEEFQGPLSREAQIAQQNLAIARANREAMRGPYAAIPSVSQARGPRGMQASEVPGGAGVPVTPGFDRNTWRQLGRASDERQAAERAMTADQRIAPADLQGRADAAKANMEARMRAKGYEQVQVMGADGQPIAGRTTWQKATPGIPYAATMQQPGNPAQAAVNRREPPPMPTIPIAQADAAMRARERQDQLHREAVRQGWAVKPNGGQPRYDEATGAPLGPVMHVNPMNDAWRRQEMARGRINAWRHGIAPGATVRAPAATAPALPQVEIPGLPPPNAGSMNVGAMLGGSVPAIPGMGSPQDLTNLGWSTVMPGMGGDPNVPATPQRRPIGTTTANRRRSPAFPGLPGGGFEQYNLPLAANGLTTPITGPSKISITPLTGPKSGIPHGVAIAGEEGPENMVIAPNAYNQGNPYVESYNRNWNQLSDIAEMVRQGREQAQQNASLGGMNTREKLGWMRQQGEDRRDENRMIVEGEQLKLGNRRADAQEAWQRGQLERQNATEARLAEYQQKNLEWQQQEKRMNDARDAYTISMQNVMRLTQPGSGATPEDIQLAKDDLEIRKAAYYAISGGPTPVLPSKPAKPPFKTEKEEATAGGDKETPTEYRTRVENNARIVKREAIRSGIVDQGGSAWWQPYGPDGNFDESAMFAHILKVLKASGAWDENQLEAEAKALTRKMMAEKARRMSLSPEQRKAEFGQKTRPGISTPGLGLY